MKKFTIATLVMALWATGAYMLGVSHGKNGGGITLPTVKVEWAPKKEEPKAAEVKTEAKAEVGNICGMESEPQPQAKVIEVKQ